MSGWPESAAQEQTTFGELTRARLMSRVRSKGNKTTEQRLVALLRAEGPSGWRRHQRLPGKPDFAWFQARVAVFVDGCFWHGHDCGRGAIPRTNTAAWKEKIRRNKARDRRVNRMLREKGWKVLRVWECRLRKKPAHCVTRIRKAVEERASC